jgi:hypothetical protein
VKLRLKFDDCFIENLATVFCRFRKASFGAYLDCRADTARADVWSERVQVRAGRRSMSSMMSSILVKTERGMASLLVL